MFTHSRKLLVLAALCWVAPLSAQQPAPAAGKTHAAKAQKHRAGCTRKAAPGRRQGAARAGVLVASDGLPNGFSLLDAGTLDSSFLP
jgi:hypothetical protein